MKLTDAQLGRIARAANNYGIYTHRDVLRCAVAGNMASAIAIVRGLEIDGPNPLLSVLRKVAEEVADAKTHADRQCVVCAWDRDGRAYGATTYVDGAWVLQEVAGRMLSREASSIWRITITNEAHGCAWTWEAGA